MSVTFSPTYQDSLTQISCSCGAAVDSTLFASQKEAYKAVFVDYTNLTPVCGDEFCLAYPASLVAFDEVPELNVSNFNAVNVFDVLGIRVGESFDDRCFGSVTAEDFMGRVLVAAGVQTADAGVPSYQEGNMIHCGRAEGYMERVVAELHTVAEYAIKHNLEVTWG